jgi:prephenate dehydrogenase
VTRSTIPPPNRQCPGQRTAARNRLPRQDFDIRPDSLAVIGLGAIGGSIAWRATRAGLPRVVGWTRERADGVEALKRGAVTELAETPERAARGAALVVLAVPPGPTLELLGRLRPWLAAGAIVTDVASVKREVVVRACGEGLADRFAGGHPLAGTHVTGFGAARPDMFEGAVVYVCPTGTPAGGQAAQGVAGFWREVMGAEPVLIEAATHDEQLAWTSHLPQAVASALAVALAGRGLRGVSYGPGGRDTTRLAASDPGLWTDILLQNRDAVAAALAAMGESVGQLRALLEHRDAAALRDFLARGADFRRGIDR